MSDSADTVGWRPGQYRDGPEDEPIWYAILQYPLKLFCDAPYCYGIGSGRRRPNRPDIEEVALLARACISPVRRLASRITKQPMKLLCALQCLAL